MGIWTIIHLLAISINFVANILVIPATGVLIGLFTGILEIGYFSKWFIKNSLTRKILIKSLIYLAIIIFFLFITILMNALYSHREHSSENILSPVREFFTTHFAAICKAIEPTTQSRLAKELQLPTWCIIIDYKT